MKRIESLLDKYKKKYRATTGYTSELFITDSELLMQEQDKFASEFNSHADFWGAVIDWATQEFNPIDNHITSRFYEKNILRSALACSSATSLTEEEHSTLLHNLDLALSNGEIRLKQNRAMGGKSTKKLTPEKISKIKLKYFELQKTRPNRYKSALVQELAEEFHLSERSINTALKELKK